MNSLKWIFSFVFIAFFSLASHAEVNGVMMVVKGDIKVTGKDGKTEPAKVGKKVTQGDTILAGADSRAKIVMADKNVINISPDSKIVIEKYENDGKDKKNVELNVLYGKVRASVEQKYDGDKSKFNVKTPSAVAGVRGTDFLMGYSQATKAAQVITFSGSVAVGQPGPGGAIRNPVFVMPGQMTQVGAGQAPEAPKSVPKEELNKMNSETKADTTSNSKQDSGDKSADSKKEEKKDDKKEDKKDASADKKDDSKKDDGKKDSSGEKSSDKNADKGGNDKKDASSNEKRDEPKKDARNSDSKPDQGRAPASASPGGSAMGPEKLPEAGGPIIPGTPPPMMLPPTLTTVTAPPQNTLINDVIKNTQKSNTTIILAPQ